jgi:MFS family permease
MDRTNEKWLVLALAALTGAFAIGIPAVSLAVLSREIIVDLHLNLVQVGLIWSIGSLPAILTSPLSGVIIDRFGPKRVILAGTFLVALTAALRGAAPSFQALLAIIILIGSLVPLITNSSYKVCSLWFPRRQLGLANGILAMGMALGLLLGSLLSATVMSPWLGGWRHVMFFYGGLAVLFCIPWTLTRPVPDSAATGPERRVVSVPMKEAVTRVVRLKNIWLLGIAFMGISGCIQGLSGYLPLHLRSLSWPDLSADGALSLFSAVSMVFILPISWLSDKVAARKRIALVMTLMIAAGVGLLSVADGWIVWGAIVLAGIVRDGTTAVLLTMVIETDGVGPVYAGTATGIVFLFFFIGNLLAPPIGNHLAEFAPGLPFVFWGGLAALAVLSLSFTSVPGNKRNPMKTQAVEAE